MVMFGMACSAMAVTATTSWPYNTQANKLVNGEDPDLLVGDGFIDMVIHFETDVSTRNSAKYQKWAELLSQNQEEIGSVIVAGSADAQRRDQKPDKNIKLSKERAEWVVKNMLPSSIAQECRFDGIERERCTVHAMGDANDIANSSGERNSNINERAARIYVIWRQQKCEQDTMNNINSAEKALVAAKVKYADKANEIQEALDIITQLNAICKNVGDKLMPSEGKEYDRLLSELAGMLVGFVNFAPELQTVTQYITEYVEVTVYNTDIAEYYYNLAKIRDGLKVSAWRDAQGNFNTSRLISDSVAGVVLGTAGGLITSHLVKKNQLKQGFEDLNCSVGGQKVASYGDEIRIGLR